MFNFYFFSFYNMSKLSCDDELNIILWRAMGQTYDDLIKTTGHGNSTISRVLKPESLIHHIVSLYCNHDIATSEVVFYKKWLYITFWVWALSTIVPFILFIL